MEEIFKKFLQEQGYYKEFVGKLSKFQRISLQQHCRQEPVTIYVIKAFPINNGLYWNELNRDWNRHWSKEKVKILYKFMVDHGCLFQFIQELPKGVTFETLCKSNFIYHMIFYNMKNYDNLRQLSTYWNRIHKKWMSYLNNVLFLKE